MAVTQHTAFGVIFSIRQQEEVILCQFAAGTGLQNTQAL